MQRGKTERPTWLRSTYERALAEVAREHARAKAVPGAARRAVAATQDTTAGRSAAAEPRAEAAV